MKLSEEKALSKIAAYCSKAERSEFDVRRKLTGWQVEDTEINRILGRLKKENFLNEERYCRSFIKDKMRFNKWGRVKITFELKKKHIPESTINSCFEGFGNEEFESPLLNILTTKAKNIKAQNEYEKQAKLIRFALGRGYSLEQIKKCLKKLDYNDEDYLESFS